MSTGKILLSGDGVILDFSVSFESLIETPSVEIYGKLISDFLEFHNLEGKTSSVIYGDFLRFGAEEMAISRKGHIKSKAGDYPADISTSSKQVGGRRTILLDYSTYASVLMVPNNLPGAWAPAVKLALNLWRQEKVLAITLIIILTFILTLATYFKFHPKHKSQIPTIKIYNSLPPSE